MRPLMRAAGHEFLDTDLHRPRRTRASRQSPMSISTRTFRTSWRCWRPRICARSILIGHSYGGMVATGVADRARDRIKHIVYLDAFAPKDGQAAFDLQRPEQVAQRREAAQKDGDGWRLADRADAAGYLA